MALADYQYRFRGLTFGDGTDIAVVSIDGLEGFDMRVGDMDIPRGDGAVRGEDFGSAKLVDLHVDWIGDSERVEEVLALWRSAFKPLRDRDEALTFKHPAQPERRLLCRPVTQRRVMEGSMHAQDMRVLLRAPDPRIYSEVEKHLQVPLFVTGDGYFDYPDDYPKDSDTAGGGEAVAVNEGDSDAHPLVRFWGPSSGSASRVRVQNITNGSEVDVVTSVGVGQILSARMREYVTGRTDVRIIDLSGASRYGDWVSRPLALRLSPGDNILRWTAEGTTDGMQCRVSYRDTWDGTTEDTNG